MEVIVGDIHIVDAAQANAYAVQGFISQKELSDALQKLSSGKLPTRKLGDLTHKTLFDSVKSLVKKVSTPRITK